MRLTAVKPSPFNVDQLQRSLEPMFADPIPIRIADYDFTQGATQ